MNTALSSTFRQKATMLSAMQMVTRPMERSTARYTSMTPQHR